MSNLTLALFGTEAEYAVTALASDGRRVPAEAVADLLLRHAAERPSLPGEEAGIFLANGGRFYIDGSHPEYASPETTDPWAAVRYSFAGDALLRELAEDVVRESPSVARLLVSKGNVGYVGQTTWASHENYLHRRPPGEVRAALIPHLVSRIVFTGSGGFDPFDVEHPIFVLSPRALFVQQLVGASALGAIALVDDRNQPHCTGFHRQHLMCGDANRSQLSMFLRIATTALVVALIDAGCAGEDEVTLVEPLPALATVAFDASLRERLSLTSGRQATAVGIQRHFLHRARQHSAVLPAWTHAACDLWEDTLDRLAEGPDAVADRLDWAIKREVFRDRSAGRSGRTLAMRAWRAELCEVDLLFGQIYPWNLFDRLDEAEVLNHRVPGVGPIEPAVSTPPADGRARIRGGVVTRLAKVVPSAICGWSGVRDLSSGRALDLESPFSEGECWRDFVAGPSPARSLVDGLVVLAAGQPSPTTTRSMRAQFEKLAAEIAREDLHLSGESAIQLNNCAVSARNAGRLEDAEWLMRASLAIDLAAGQRSRRKLAHRRNNLATVLLMQGRTAEARRELALAWNHVGTQYDVTSARVLTIRLAVALVDREPTDLFVGQLKSHFAIRPMCNFAEVDWRWQLGCVLESLAPRIDEEALALLQAIGELVNRLRHIDSLQEMSLWRHISPIPLETAWSSLVE